MRPFLRTETPLYSWIASTELNFAAILKQLARVMREEGTKAAKAAGAGRSEWLTSAKGYKEATLAAIRLLISRAPDPRMVANAIRLAALDASTVPLEKARTQPGRRPRRSCT
jgi:hypothetical protein